MKYNTYQATGFYTLSLIDNFCRASFEGWHPDEPSDEPAPPTYRAQRPEWSP